MMNANEMLSFTIDSCSNAAIQHCNVDINERMQVHAANGFTKMYWSFPNDSDNIMSRPLAQEMAMDYLKALGYSIEKTSRIGLIIIGWENVDILENNEPEEENEDPFEEWRRAGIQMGL